MPLFDFNFDFVYSNDNLNMTMSYGGTQKGAISPYSLAEHRYFIMEPQDFGNVSLEMAAKYDGSKISKYSPTIINYYPERQSKNTGSSITINNSIYIGYSFKWNMFGLPGSLPPYYHKFAFISDSSYSFIKYNFLFNSGDFDNCNINKIIVYNNTIYAFGDFNKASSSSSSLPPNYTALNSTATNARYAVKNNINGGSWTELSGGTNAAVKDAVLINNEDLYIVGNFTQTGPNINNARYIAKYNISSSAWINMSGGLSGVTNCIIAAGNDLYVGGLFVTGSSSLGGEITLNNIAKWNTISKTWSSLGNGLNNEVKCLFYDSDTTRLYAGGSFTTASYGTASVLVNYVGYYYNNEWYALDENKLLNNEVLSITKFDEDIYLGGNFTNTINSDYNIPYLAKYTDNYLYAVGKSVNNSVYSFATGSNNLYLVGDFTSTFFGKQTITTKDIYIPFEAANYDSYRLAPRPQYVFNNHLPSSTGSSNFGGMKIFDLNPNNPLIPTKTYKSEPEAIFVLNDGYIYETDKLSGKKPFFNSYDEYFEDLKPLSQKYSIIPEFRMENVIDYYLKEKNGDFTAGLTSSYLSLDSNVDNLDDINSNINLTNPIKTFIEDVNIPSRVSNLSITVNGLKKLLPYNGFYPQQRVAQLADKFINSFIDTTSKYLSNDGIEYDTNLSNGTPRDQQILTLLQPLFAPGILMNSIKSSIAVDWPAFIGNYGAYSGSKPNFYETYNLTLAENSPFTNGYNTSYCLSADKFDFRFPFESLLEFDKIIPSQFKTGSNNLYYLDPTYYSTDVVSGSDRQYLRYPCYNLSTGSLKPFNFINNTYKLSMHNFLAEVPNFFLQNGLNNFISEKIDTVTPLSGVAYILDVKLSRNPSEYKEFIQHPLYESLRNLSDTFISGTYLPPGADSLYGPPCRFFLDFSAIASVAPINEMIKYSLANYELKYLDSPAYAPYVPPYYYGESVARIVFLPDENRPYTLQEIQENAKKYTYFFNTGSDTLFDYKNSLFGSENPSSKYNTLAYKERMNLSASVNLFSETEIQDVSIDVSTGIPKESLSPNNKKYSWVIQTKFETPSINFAKVGNYNNLGMNFLGGTKSDYVEGIYSNLYKGLWTSYGKPVTEDEGIKLSILPFDFNLYVNDVPTAAQAGATDVAHLTDLINFADIAGNNTRTIGLIANKKIIKEGVVVILYIMTDPTYNESEFASLAQPIFGENGNYVNLFPYNTPRYFKIDKKIISDALGLGKAFETATFEEIKKQVNSNKVNPNNSIIKTIKAMTEFVIPPHLNWVKNTNLEPFVMYIFPFSSELDTDDLSDIWQGVMPKQARRVEKESIEINHGLEENEMFHGKKLPQDIKFKIFKVKQQANINYYKLTNDSKDDANFKFTFNNQEKVPDYSFNYPYDYFSLVELVNVDAKITISKIG